MANRAKSVYASDISYGSTPFRRGHWADRLAAIDTDIKAFNAFLITHYGESLATLSSVAPPIRQDPQTPKSAVPPKHALHPVPRPIIAAQHTTPESFHPGSDLPLTVSTPATVTQAILWYRPVNQGERWLSTPMQHTAGTHTAAIPAAYTDSPYPLQYYFELHTATSATLHPAFNPTLSNQPYFAVHLRS
jgi:hypothetical protein